MVKGLLEWGYLRLKHKTDKLNNWIIYSSMKRFVHLECYR